MPRTITTSVVIDHVNLTDFHVKYDAAGLVTDVQIRYELIDDGGRVYQIKQNGGENIPAQLRTGLENIYTNLKNAITSREGL